MSDENILPEDVQDFVKSTAEKKVIIRDVNSFKEVKPGDQVIRHFYGILMTLVVESVDDEIIHTVAGYMFYRDTGFEYDPEIGLTKENNLTCSWLINYIPKS